MDVTLKPELEKFIQDKMADGRFSDPSQVIAMALEVWREEERLDAEELEELRRKIAVGIEELDRGEGEPWDVEEIIAAAHRRYSARQAPNAPVP